MTTTSVFQGIQDGSKLSSRVLKPPGGGSSISFMDDPSPTRSSGASTPQESAPKSSIIFDQEASPIPSKNASTTASTPTPVTETKNGMDNLEEISLKENIPPPPPMSEKDYEILLKDSLNGCKINKEFSPDTKPLPLLEDFPNFKSVSGVNGVNGTHEKNPNLVNGGSLYEKISSPNLTPTKMPSPLLQNGSNSSPNLSASNSSLSSPSMKPNQDTKERVIGHTDETISPRPSQQPRKIKDHMRSSIIMSDEDYTPTRSSRFNATVNDTPPQNLPSAGQRQRIPPGGFSSKLW